MLSKRSNRKTGTESPWDSDPFLWEPLEQRLLLSADSVGAVIGDGAVLSILDREQQEDAVDMEALVSFLDQEPPVESSQDRSPTPLPDAVDLEPLASLTGANAPAEPAADTLLTWLSDSETQDSADPGADAAEKRHEILFVDTRTPDHQQLLDGIARGSGNSNLEIVFLNPEHDGIDQISEVLAGHSPVEAIHIISHGSSGAIQLGNGWLYQENLAGYASAIEGWSEALTADADLLLYGCNLAANDDGQALIRSLGGITGADVAASDDITGNQALGGDWDLEYQVGSLESTGIVTPQLQEAWAGVLSGVQPSVSLANGIVSFSENDPPALIDAGLTVSDPDDADLTGATATISTGLANTEDDLSFDAALAATAGITGNYDPATGVLTFSGLASVAEYQDLLRTVAYANLSEDPDTTDRWVTVEVDDGTGTDSDDRRFKITSVNDAPAIDLDANDSGGTGTDFATIFSAGGNPVLIADADATLADIDTSTLNSLVIQITNKQDGTDEVLTADTTGTDITATWNSGQSKLTLDGVDSIANYQQVLRTVTYDNGSADPTADPPRLITFVANDGTDPSSIATSKVYVQKTSELWFTVDGDVLAPNGVPELPGFDDEQILSLTSPVFEPGISGGTVVPVFDLDPGGSQGDIDALHFVSRSISVAGQQLQYGDLLFSVKNPSTLGVTWVWPEDLILFRPGDLNDYDAGGTYSVLINNLTGDFRNLIAVSLIEQDTYVGDTWLDAGTLISIGTSNDRDDIYHYDPDSDTRSLLINGDDPAVGIINDVSGLDLIETTTVIGGATLQPGQILVTEAWDGLYAAEDVFTLTVTGTEWSAPGNSAATGTLLFEGADKGLNSPEEAINGISLYATEGAPVPVNNPPVFTASGPFSPDENSATLSVVGNIDANNGEGGAADAGITYAITANVDPDGDGNDAFSINGASGVITVNDAGDLDYEGAPSLLIEVLADDGVKQSTSNVTVNLNDVNEAPTADPGGPYAIYEGGSITFDAGGSTDPDGDGPTYTWDIGNDGTFEESGETVSFNWTELKAAGVTDSGSHQVLLKATDAGTLWDTTLVTLDVANTAPVITLSGPTSVEADTLYTLNLSTTDPGDDTVDRWTIDWGDGHFDSYSGNPASVTHTYSSAGTGLTYNLLASVRDEDGTFLQNELIVTSYGGDSVSRFEATTGAFLQKFAVDEGLVKPIEPVVGPDGNLYVSGEASKNVLRYDATTGVLIDEFIDAAGSGLTEAGGLRFGPDGNLYVADFGGDQVLRYDSTTGNLIGAAFITPGSGGLTQPYGLTFGPDGDLYVNSYNSSQVLRYDGADGTSKGVFVDDPGIGGLSTPEAMLFGPDGNLYVASYDTDNVLRYDGNDGTSLGAFVAAGGLGDLKKPTGLSFGPDGHLYVADFTDGEVLRYHGTTGTFLNSYVAAGDVVSPTFISFIPQHQVEVTPVGDDAPVFTATGPFSLNENSADLTVVGNVDANDGDGGATDAGISYSITANVDPDGDGTDAFSIDSNGIIKVLDAGDLDYESDTSLTITVQADDGALQSSTDIDIALNPLNDNAPVVTSANSANVAENSTAIHKVTATDDDLPGDTLGFSIAGSGDDDALFSIDAAGNLRFIAAPDYELPADTGGDNGYQVDVAVLNGANTTVQRINVTVTDENDEAPVFTATGPFSLDENPAVSAVVGNVDANDGDGGAADTGISYSITTNVDPDGDGTDAFSIDSNGIIKVLDAGDLDYESDTSLTITVQADDGALQSSTDIDIDLNPLNDNAPVVTSANSANVAENSTAIHKVTASDDDLPGDTLSFSIAGSGADDALFSIDGAGNLSFDAAPDYELPADTGGDNGYQVDVAVFDGANTTVQRINVTVTAENDNAPVVTSASSANVAENSTAVHKVTASDDDLPGDTLGFSIAGSGDDDALFSIDAAGNLSFIAAPDYELPADTGGNNVYQVDVAVLNGANTTVQRIDVTVTAENDNAPVVTSPNSANVAENSTAVNKVTASDDDLPGDTLGFSIAGSGADDALFGIDGAGNLSFDAGPDYELPADTGGDNGYQVDVAVFDGASTTVQRIDVTVTAENDNAPVVTSANSANVAENSTAIHKVTASDDDLPGDTLGFSIAGSGADDALFSIDGAGNLSFDTGPDYELPADTGGDNGYQVDVAVFDGANTTVQRINVTVTAENDNVPVITSASSANVAENSTAVHQVTATDADLPGDTLGFSIAGTGADDALFSIDAAGNLSFVAAPDYELPADAGGDNSYQVDVAVFDGANTTVQPISVTVTGVNEAPQIDLGIPGSTISVVTGSTKVIDVDAHDAENSGLTYTISGVDATVLEINPVTGALSFQSASDYEAPVDMDGNNVYSITVSVSDGTNSISQPLTIKVTPEASEIASLPTPDIMIDIRADRMGDGLSPDLSTKTAKESTDETPETRADGLSEEAGNAEQPPREQESTSPSGFGSGLILPERRDTDSDPSEPSVPPKLDIDTETKPSNQPLSEWKKSLVTLIAGADPLELLARPDFIDGLDEMRDDIEDRMSFDRAMVGSTVALSSGLSVGYVAWLIRSGTLLSGLLTSLPAWQFVDPMPVLAFVKKQPKKDLDDDDSLESMVSASDEKEVTNAQEPQDNLSPHENQ